MSVVVDERRLSDEIEALARISDAAYPAVTRVLFTPTDLYVAWTRARHRLILVCQSGEIRAAVEAALADAEGADEPPCTEALA